MNALTALFFAFAAGATYVAPPASPLDPQHPGSEIGARAFTSRAISCQNRDVDVYLPNEIRPGETFPVVVYGHGQALKRNVYEKTFEHLAGKGVAVIFPAYDNGFFDQDWQRMGADFVHLSDCALAKFAQLDSSRVIYSGHSKGAYIASIAAGLATGLHAVSNPKALITFETAGVDESSLKLIDPSVALTVIFADQDTTVTRDLSERLYSGSPTLKKQFIYVRSYSQTNPQLKADHMWPLTESGFFGGAPPNALHYFGSWKWLTAAAMDLSQGSRFENPYLYGDLTADKGISGLADDVKRSW